MESELAERIAAGRGVAHLHSLTSGLAVRVVLDALTSAEALERGSSSHGARNSDSDFVAAFACNTARQLLDTAAFVHRHAASAPAGSAS